MTEPKRKLRLGDLLVQAGAITEEQLMTALTEQKKSGMRLGRALISMGYVDEDKLLNILSQQLKLPYIDLKNFNFDEDLVRRLPETLARRFRAVILKKQGGGLLVGMSDPMDIFAYDEISRVLGVSVEQAVVRESELLEALDMVYRRIGEISSLAEELQDELGEDQFDL